jgi:hypothetical protein
VTRKIESPTVVPADGTEPKLIEEYVGRVNSGDASVSIARMTSPQGWVEPAQTPELTSTPSSLPGHSWTSRLPTRLLARDRSPRRLTQTAVPREEWRCEIRPTSKDPLVALILATRAPDLTRSGEALAVAGQAESLHMQSPFTGLTARQSLAWYFLGRKPVPRTAPNFSPRLTPSPPLPWFEARSLLDGGAARSHEEAGYSIRA